MKQPLTSSLVAIKSLKSEKKKCAQKSVSDHPEVGTTYGTLPPSMQNGKTTLVPAPAVKPGFHPCFFPRSIHRNVWCCWERNGIKKNSKKKKNEAGQTKCLLSFLQLSAQRWRQPWWLQVDVRVPPCIITAKDLNYEKCQAPGCRLPMHTARVSDRGAPLPLGLQQCSELYWINTLVLSC